MNHFNDFNYLTGRRMQRNQNDAIVTTKAPHLKHCLKRSRPHKTEFDDIAKFKMKKPWKRINSKNHQRITLEPNLNILCNNKAKKPQLKFGIFVNSVFGGSFDLAHKERQKTIEDTSPFHLSQPDVSNNLEQPWLYDDEINISPIRSVNDDNHIVDDEHWWSNKSSGLFNEDSFQKDSSLQIDSNENSDDADIIHLSKDRELFEYAESEINLYETYLGNNLKQLYQIVSPKVFKSISKKVRLN